MNEKVFWIVVSTSLVLCVVVPMMLRLTIAPLLPPVPECELEDLEMECYRYYDGGILGVESKQVGCDTQHDFYYYWQKNYNCTYSRNNTYQGKKLYGELK